MLSRFFDRITKLAIQYRWSTIGLTTLSLIAGIWAMQGLNLEMLPRIEFPQTIVLVQWPDSESSDQFLEEITIPLEEKLQTISGVVNIESTTNKSFGLIIVRNDFGLNQEDLIEEIKTTVNNTTLPETADPQILNFSLSDLPVVVVSASSATLTLPEIKQLVETELQPQLAQIDQVSEVTIGGGQELPEEEAVTQVAEAAPTATPAPSPTPDPEGGKLSFVAIQGVKTLGVNIEYAQEITPDLLRTVGAEKPEQVLFILDLMPLELLPYLPKETLALLPVEFTDKLEPELFNQLYDLAADLGGIGQYTTTEALEALNIEPTIDMDETAVPETVSETVTLPSMNPVLLPPTWIGAAAQAGLTITDTSDLNAPFLQGLLQFAPELITELTPEMWRALSPDLSALLLPTIVETLDPTLVAQLQAIQLAANGFPPTPAPLPETWIAAIAQTGLTLTSTAAFPAEAMTPIVAFAPELLTTLTPETLYGFTPELLASLPSDYIQTLDPDVSQTLNAIIVADATFKLNNEMAANPTEPVDPARLPELMIQASQATGMVIEFAQDVSPDLIRTLANFGPQGVQFLSMLTPDNLRLLPPESIALLPISFLDSLDADLRTELDTIASEWGGAGQLALKEEAEATETAANDTSPSMAGIWLEPDAEGNPSQFPTAQSLIDNPFTPGAAALLNVFPNSPNVENPVDWMSALTPEVMTYLAENETDFVPSLSPIILEMMSPETLSFLLESYPDAFDDELATRLAGIAQGEIEAFIPESSITRTDGNPSVIINLFKDGDANTVEVAHRVFDQLDKFTKEYPELQTNLVFEQATFIEDSIAGVSREGALGAIFAVIVIILFLSGHVGGKYKLSWRATVVTAVSIPLSIFTAFLFMRIIPPTLGSWLQTAVESTDNSFLTFISRLFPTSITLNIMTLSGLTVAIGRVVDDSIVVLENSYRFIQQGIDPKEAVIRGTREVAVAIFSATVTTMAVFLPLGLIGGVIGSFFLPFGLTVTYALAASYIVSITVVPALTYMMISKKDIPEEKESMLQRWYTPALTWALNNRGTTMVLATLLFVASLFLLGQLPQSFIPGLGDPTINITVTMPAETQMVETNELVSQFETEIVSISGLEKIQTEIGGSGGFEAMFGGGTVAQNQANLTISTENPDDLNRLANELRQEAQMIFGEENVRVSAAAQTGFSGFALILTGNSLSDLRSQVEDVKQTLASVDVDGDGIPDIANVTSTADDMGTTGSDTIIRIDGRSAISFGGELETTNTLGVTNAAKEAITSLALPSGTEVTEGYDSQQQVEGFQNMISAIGYSIIIVYFIMAITFRSLTHPFTILFSLPFALVGAAIALYITNSVLGISAMIGMMMLVGVVVTNGIVLMELVQQLRERDVPTREALLEAGRTRLRPILMTALTAILALIPLAASQEAGALIASELAITVMGGLIVSTALTLVVVPVVYSLIDQGINQIRNRKVAK